MDPRSGLCKEMDIIIQDGKILKMGENLEQTEFWRTVRRHELQTIDAEGYVVAPGLVDVHVHFRDPGFTAKEDIYTGLVFAIKTTLVKPPFAAAFEPV